MRKKINAKLHTQNFLVIWKYELEGMNPKRLITSIYLWVMGLCVIYFFFWNQYVSLGTSFLWLTLTTALSSKLPLQHPSLKLSISENKLPIFLPILLISCFPISHSMVKVKNLGVGYTDFHYIVIHFVYYVYS